MAAVSHPAPHPGILTCQDLLRATGFVRVGDLQRCLDDQGVRYFRGRGGEIWTTIDLLNAAGGVLPSSASNASRYSPEDFR